MDKIEKLRETIKICVVHRGMTDLAAVCTQVEKVAKAIGYELSPQWRERVEYDMSCYLSPPTPSERQDWIQEFLEENTGTTFRREDIQEEFGFTKDQTQRDLKSLRDAGRIGYRSERVAMPNARNPKVPFWRRDAVYFALLPEETKPEPELKFPITLNNMDEVRAFLEVVKTLV